MRRQDELVKMQQIALDLESDINGMLTKEQVIRNEIVKYQKMLSQEEEIQEEEEQELIKEEEEEAAEREAELEKEAEEEAAAAAAKEEQAEGKKANAEGLVQKAL